MDTIDAWELTVWRIFTRAEAPSHARFSVFWQTIRTGVTMMVNGSDPSWELIAAR